MIKLQKDPRRRSGVPWTACKPFLENRQAVLIHRVRYVTTHKIGPKWKAHLGIHLWCGSITVGSDKFTFLDEPPEGRLVCARCESAVIAAGLPASSDIAGRHVHLGGVVAVQTCRQTADASSALGAGGPPP